MLLKTEKTVAAWRLWAALHLWTTCFVASICWPQFIRKNYCRCITQVVFQSLLHNKQECPGWSEGWFSQLPRSATVHLRNSPYYSRWQCVPWFCFLKEMLLTTNSHTRSFETWQNQTRTICKARKHQNLIYLFAIWKTWVHNSANHPDRHELPHSWVKTSIFHFWAA